MRIKTLIVEQDASVLRKLTAALDLEEDFEVVGACQDVPSVAASWAMSRPDLLFLDAACPELSASTKRASRSWSASTRLAFSSAAEPAFRFL